MSSARSFIAIPRDLVRDHRISEGAKLTYAALADLAWQSGWRKGGQHVQMPPMKDVAQHVGVTLPTFRRRLDELRASGWIELQRAARQRPATYVVYDDTTGPRDTIRVLTSEHTKEATETPFVCSPVSTRNGSSPSSTTRDIGGVLRTPPPGGGYDPAVGRRIDGANLPFDAIVAATGATGRLNGGRVAKALQSIREEAWATCLANGFTLDRAQAEPDVYERRLAGEITSRAAKLQRQHPEWTVTPETVARYWSRLAADGRPTSRVERITAAANRALEAVAR